MHQIAVIPGKALQKHRGILAKLRQDADKGESFTQGRAGDHPSSLDRF